MSPTLTLSLSATHLAGSVFSNAGWRRICSLLLVRREQIHWRAEAVIRRRRARFLSGSPVTTGLPGRQECVYQVGVWVSLGGPPEAEFCAACENLQLLLLSSPRSQRQRFYHHGILTDKIIMDYLMNMNVKRIIILILNILCRVGAIFTCAPRRHIISTISKVLSV